VVLPVRNEELYIEETLAQLRLQDYPHERVEFLVCDGGSDDRTREIVRRLADDDPRIRLLDNPGRRSSAGRNVGFRHARGEMILVVDGHVRIPSLLLFQEVERCFRQSRAGCLGRPQPLVPDRSRWSAAIAHARASRFGHSPASFIFSDGEGFVPADSVGAAYRPEVFEQIGFVDEDFDACEDLEFNTRLDKAGIPCFFSPRLTVQYYARNGLRQLFRQMRRYGFGRYKYARRHPDRLSAAQLAPAALVGLLASLPAAVLLSPRLRRAGSALAATYLLADVAASLALALRTRRGFLPHYLVIFPTIHLGIGVGFLHSAVRGGKLPPAPTGS
jgi:glycosyltransferase involved in cell wall biosynthesis